MARALETHPSLATRMRAALVYGFAAVTLLGTTLAPAFAQTNTPTSTATSTPTQTPTPTRTPTSTPIPTLGTNVCYAVPDSTDQLIQVDPVSGVEAVIGATGAPGTIYGLAAAPVGNTMYATTHSRFGTVSTTTGAFSSIGTSYGIASGLYGPITLDNVVDLTINPGNGKIFGVHRMALGEVCYGIAGSNDRLVTIDKTSGSEVETVVGTTSSDIEAIAIIGTEIYAAADDQLGVINRTSAAFTARSNTFGTTASPTVETIDNVQGLAYDPINDILYASQRVVGGDDLLIVVDRLTGALVPAQFNAGADDYLEISGICDSDSDIEAIAFDPVNEILYGSNDGDLVEIDLTNGDCDDIGDFGNGGPTIEIYGLGFDANGDLFGTGDNGFYSIDVATGAATLVAPTLTAGTDYRAFDCSYPLPDLLFRVDPVTGSHVPFEFFSATVSYATIENAGDCGTSTEALAFDQETDLLYGADTIDQQLITVDPDSGFCDNPVPPDALFSDILDMSFAGSGVLYATGNNTLYSVNNITGVVTTVAGLTAGTGYEAFECPRSGCNLVVRKRHEGVPYAGSTLAFEVSWLNPCDGVLFTNVTITDPLPSGLQLVAASSPDASTVTNGNTVTFTDTFLEKAPLRTATVFAKITALEGSQITNEVTLRDNYGREFTGQDKLRVREPRNRLSLDLHGQQKSQSGKSITYTARYRNLTGSGTLVVVLPSDVSIINVFPPATSAVGNVLTWSGRTGPSGSVRVRTRVNSTSAGTITATASLAGAGGSVEDEHKTSVRVVPTATPTPTATPVRPTATPTSNGVLSITAVRRVIAGSETQVTVQYTGTNAPSTITVTLPAQMSVTQTTPAAAVSGQRISWTGQPSPSGSLRFKALVAAGTPAGTDLGISATISGGASGSANASMEVRAD